MKITFDNSQRHSRSGIALIMVLVVTTVLGIIAAGFAYTMKVETKLARNETWDAEMYWAARSGVERARWYHSMPNGQGPLAQLDALNSPWTGNISDTNSNALLEFPLKGFQIGQATVDVTIEDCDRKLNINTVDRMVLQEALNLIGVNDGAWASTVVDSIMDWRDRDDNPGVSGAESDAYMSNPNPGYPPYVAKNGPINDMSELLMVRGVTPALYWGGQSGGHWQPPRLRGSSQFEEPSFPIGLVDIFTANSGGRLNINTASRTTLQAIPGLDANMVEEMIIKVRAGPDGVEGTIDDTPILNPGQIGMMGMMPGGPPMAGRPPMAPGGSPTPMGQISQLFTTRSLMFQAKVTVNIGGSSKTYYALLRRNNPKDIQILNMYWD